MDSFISERMRRVLEIIVEDYIQTAEPVGSRVTSRKSNLNLSPATIRNIMSDLEELGLLLSTPSLGRKSSHGEGTSILR